MCVCVCVCPLEGAVSSEGLSACFKQEAICCFCQAVCCGCVGSVLVSPDMKHRGPTKTTCRGRGEEQTGAGQKIMGA